MLLLDKLVELNTVLSAISQSHVSAPKKEEKVLRNTMMVHIQCCTRALMLVTALRSYLSKVQIFEDTVDLFLHASRHISQTVPASTYFHELFQECTSTAPFHSFRFSEAHSAACDVLSQLQGMSPLPKSTIFCRYFVSSGKRAVIHETQHSTACIVAAIALIGLIAITMSSTEEFTPSDAILNAVSILGDDVVQKAQNITVPFTALSQSLGHVQASTISINSAVAAEARYDLQEKIDVAYIAFNELRYKSKAWEDDLETFSDCISNQVRSLANYIQKSS